MRGFADMDYAMGVAIFSVVVLVSAGVLYLVWRWLRLLVCESRDFFAEDFGSLRPRDWGWVLGAAAVAAITPLLWGTFCVVGKIAAGLIVLYLIPKSMPDPPWEW